MTVSLSPMARLQFTISGAPLSGGLLFTYAAGTTTKLATYTDATGLTPNTNPVVLDTQGFCDLWLTDGSAYKLVLSPPTDTDPPSNAYWSRDNVSNNVFPFSPTVGTINGVRITPPASLATLTLVSGSTLATAGAHSITLTSTADSVVTLPTGGTLARNDQASDTFGALTDVTTNNSSTIQHGFLPKLSGSGVQFLSGLGTWVSAPGQNLIRSARTSNTILGSADNGSFVDITSGTFTQTFTAVATLGSGWYIWLRNSGTGDITLDPNASELIDGLTSYIMYPGESRLVQCDGTQLTSVVVTSFYRAWTTSGTWIKPPGYLSLGIMQWSGGASGQRTNSAVTASAGGFGGGCFPATIPMSSLGATETVTIGAGGAAVTTVAVGNSGGDTIFNSLTIKGATTTNAGAISDSSGNVVVYQMGSNNSTSDGFGAGQGSTTISISSVWAGATIATNGSITGGNSVYGGAPGGSLSNAAVVRAPGTSSFGGNGGPAASASNGTSGVAPGGGGGATQTGTSSGAGARGELRMWGIA